MNEFLALIRRGDFLVLDSETTGLDRGEIVQIAIVSAQGDVLLDTLLKPVGSIPPNATAIHGITDEMVASAPGWGEIAPRVRAAIQGHDLVVYNAGFDLRMMYQSDEAAGLQKTVWLDIARWHCAMEAYAKFWGEWNDYYASYKWQRLSAACYQQGIELNGAHSALGDAMTTLALVKKMAAKS